MWIIIFLFLFVVIVVAVVVFGLLAFGWFLFGPYGSLLIANGHGLEVGGGVFVFIVGVEFGHHLFLGQGRGPTCARCISRFPCSRKGA